MIKKKKAKPLFFVLIFMVVIVIGTFLGRMYLLAPVDKNNHDDVEVVIESGSSTSKIGKILKENGLIKSELFFKAYIRVHNVQSLKASTYFFQKSMSLAEIVLSLEEGNTYNPDQVRLTFREGIRIVDYAEEIVKKTNHSYEEVISYFQDREYAKSLISEYWFLTDDILSSDIYYPLEGYLAPDTYYFYNADVEISTIIETLLNEMEEVLSTYRETIQDHVHSYITMASVVELEGTNTENRKMIVGIFQNRLSSGMNMGSDVTTYYGLQAPMSEDLNTEQFASVNGYNTRLSSMIGKMPVGPICSVSSSSIEASVFPTESDYLFFVADKHGNIYYTKTNAEHNKKIAEIKEKGDWIW